MATQDVDYETILLSLKMRVSAERNFVANLSNVSASLWYQLRLVERLTPINWLGFYVATGSLSEVAQAPALVLGPFQGKPACSRIGSGSGVCGAAAEQRRTVLVPDVHDFPGHIACDPSSQSEVVVPLIEPASGVLVGVLDIDSSAINSFTQGDVVGLEKIAAFIVSSCDWPSQWA